MGQLYELPAAQVHFAINLGCDMASFISIFPLGTTTQFSLPALTAMSTPLGNWYINGSLPALLGVPFSANDDCQLRCQQGAEVPSLG